MAAVGSSAGSISRTWVTHVYLIYVFETSPIKVSLELRALHALRTKAIQRTTRASPTYGYPKLYCEHPHHALNGCLYPSRECSMPGEV